MARFGEFSVEQDSQPNAQLLRLLLAWWQERRGQAPYPPRAALDPLDVWPLIGRLVLIELRSGDYFYRVHGTKVAEEFGFDLTRRWLDAMPDTWLRALARQSYDQVAESGMPMLTRRDGVGEHSLRRYEALLVPLGEASRVTHILLGTVPLPALPAAAGNSTP